MFVRTYTGAVAGIGAVGVTVEVSITGGGTGLPSRRANNAYARPTKIRDSV